MEGFSFVTPVIGLNRPNTGKEDYIYIYIYIYTHTQQCNFFPGFDADFSNQKHQGCDFSVNTPYTENYLVLTFLRLLLESYFLQCVGDVLIPCDTGVESYDHYRFFHHESVWKRDLLLIVESNIIIENRLERMKHLIVARVNIFN
jgi:hypothetical protein